jgi:hypothetical protein
MTQYKYHDSNHVVDKNNVDTLIPIDDSVYVAWLAEGNTLEPVDPQTTEQIIAGFAAAVQSRLDTFAHERNYDGIMSLCTYATDPNPRFAAEGQCGVDLRSSTWAACYQIMGEVQAGTRTMPATDELLALLPAMEWPV